jgi:hypothetical protein
MVSNSVGFKLAEVRLKMGQKWCRTPTTSVPLIHIIYDGSLITHWVLDLDMLDMVLSCFVT